jgi:hypothetical protein
MLYVRGVSGIKRASFLRCGNMFRRDGVGDTSMTDNLSGQNKITSKISSWNKLTGTKYAMHYLN